MKYDLGDVTAHWPVVNHSLVWVGDVDCKWERGGRFCAEWGRDRKVWKVWRQTADLPLQPAVSLVEFYRLGAWCTHATICGLCCVWVRLRVQAHLSGLFFVVQDTSETRAASLHGAILPAPPPSSLTTAPPVTAWTATATSPWPTWVFQGHPDFSTAPPPAPLMEVSALFLRPALPASLSLGFTV